MVLFLLIVGYLLSIVLCSVLYRIASPKYLDIFSKYEAECDFMWFIPGINTLIVIFMIGLLLIVFICMLCDKLIKRVRFNIRFKWLDNFITKFKNEDL
jgi:hypothetical protein